MINDSHEDEKASYLSHFSHFFYELGRATYGPLAEAVIIRSYLTDFSKYFRYALDRKTYERHAAPSRIVDGRLQLEGKYIEQKNDFTYICSKCFELRVAAARTVPSFDSSRSALEA